MKRTPSIEGIISLPINAQTFIYRLSSRYFYYAVPALVAVLLAQSANITTSYILKRLVDALTESPDEIWTWVIVFVGLYAVSEACWRTSGYMGMLWITNVRALSNNVLFDWLSRHSSGYFADRFAGSLATKVSHASNGIGNILPQTLWNFLPTILRLTLSILIAGLAKPILALLLTSWCLAFLAFNAAFLKKKARLSKASAASFTKLKGQMIDIITNIRAVHQFGHLDTERNRVEYYVEDQKNKIFRSWRFTEGLIVMNNVLQVILLSAMLATSIWLHNTGTLTVGDVVMIVNLTWGILGSLLFISNSLNALMENYGQVQEGLEEILHRHDLVDTPNAPIFEPKGGKIEFRDVRFLYDEHTPVLEHFNLVIDPGQKVGLVGESGAGKSTLSKLVLRMYDIQGGEILIDGQNIAEVNQQSLRKAISFVPQSSNLFHRSLKDNIQYGDLEASFEEVQLAAQRAGAHGFIQHLPEGYETLVGERGIKLSGGQAQRVSIARAMLKNAPILILDEATSALDSESEQIVQSALLELIQNKTVIAIAHRLSTLLAMDRIIVIADGTIIEDGSHAELIKQDGQYAKLWKHQAGGFLVEA